LRDKEPYPNAEKLTPKAHMQKMGSSRRLEKRREENGVEMVD
jgi:hypothetical protein